MGPKRKTIEAKQRAEVSSGYASAALFAGWSSPPQALCRAETLIEKYLRWGGSTSPGVWAPSALCPSWFYLFIYLFF